MFFIAPVKQDIDLDIYIYDIHSKLYGHSFASGFKICLIYLNISPLSRGSLGDFLGDPVVDTLPSSARGEGSIAGGGLRIPHAMRCNLNK